MARKRDLHTLLDEEIFQLLEKHKQELGDQKSVIEKALVEYDRRKHGHRLVIGDFVAVIKRKETGVAALDRALEGGIPEGFLVVVTGPPGCGKTTLAMQFLQAGVAKKERGICFSAEETAEQLARHCLSFGWDLKHEVENERLDLIGFSRLPIDEMQNLILRYGAKRVVFDSINLFHTPQELRASDSWRSLLKVLKENGVTTLLITEKPSSQEGASDPMDFMGDGILQMGTVETRDEVLRYLQVRKMRATKHSMRRFQVEVGKQGLQMLGPLVAER
ncbi:MAG: AAA family ATPase [Euryarchaeota archaeon]|nr:AAA family ATPase [Euryarchaeota archaeon]